jgi:hypothetical protein
LGVRTSAITGANFYAGAEHPFTLVSPLRESSENGFYGGVDNDI